MNSPRRKITSQLLSSMSTVRGDQELPIIIQYVPKRRLMRQAQLTAGMRQSYQYRVAPFAHAHATLEAISALEQDDEVVRIYQDSPVHALMDQAPAHVGVPHIWATGYDGAGVSIAIVDTGIDPQHPDLEGRIVDMLDFTSDGEFDNNGHGTHCAGIAVGTGRASDGRYRGVAPGATVVSARVLDAYGNGMMSDVMAGIDWAVSAGVQIISLSLGGAGPLAGEDPLVELCHAAVDLGVMVCVAAGNTGPGRMTIGSPGSAEKVLTVGAIDRANNIAPFSSRGPTVDGRIKPDVVLPGSEIVAARATGTALGTPQGQWYTAISGTSMACPMAAGLCALTLQAQPSLRPSELKELIMQSALDLGTDANAQGKGLADGRRLFAALGIPLSVEPSYPPSGPVNVPEPMPDGSPEAAHKGCMIGWLNLLRRRQNP